MSKTIPLPQILAEWPRFFRDASDEDVGQAAIELLNKIAASRELDTYPTATHRAVSVEEMKVLEDILATHLPDGVWQTVDSLLIKWRLGSLSPDTQRESR
jgi:hypothetical protein